jgi:hypothetical protein
MSAGEIRVVVRSIFIGHSISDQGGKDDFLPACIIAFSPGKNKDRPPVFCRPSPVDLSLKKGYNDPYIFDDFSYFKGGMVHAGSDHPGEKRQSGN